MKQVPDPEPEQDANVLSRASSDVTVEAPARVDRVNVVLLFVAAVLYASAVGGAMEILAVFVMNEPLSWTATQVTLCDLDA